MTCFCRPVHTLSHWGYYETGNAGATTHTHTHTQTRGSHSHGFARVVLGSVSALVSQRSTEVVVRTYTTFHALSVIQSWSCDDVQLLLFYGLHRFFCRFCSFSALCNTFVRMILRTKIISGKCTCNQHINQHTAIASLSRTYTIVELKLVLQRHTSQGARSHEFAGVPYCFWSVCALLLHRFTEVHVKVPATFQALMVI